MQYLYLDSFFDISAWASSHSLKIFLVKVLVTCFQNFVAVGNIFSNNVHQLLSTFCLFSIFEAFLRLEDIEKNRVAINMTLATSSSELDIFF